MLQWKLFKQHKLTSVGKGWHKLGSKGGMCGPRKIWVRERENNQNTLHECQISKSQKEKKILL